MWKPGDRAAGNGDEAKGKHLARDDQPGAVHEPADGRHLQVRQHDEYPERQGEDRAELHERAQVAARRQQQPHRQHARRQAVENNRPRQRDVPQPEQPAQLRALDESACRPTPPAAGRPPR